MAGITTPRRRACPMCSGRGSELAITHLEMGWLVPCLGPTANPVGDPVDHLPGTDARVAEKAVAHLAGTQNCIVAFRACEGHRPVAQPTELFRDAADAQELRPRDVDNKRGTRGTAQR